MSHLGKTEKIIFFVAMLIVVVFSYFLYDDSFVTFSKGHNTQLELIGDFTISQNDVRRKNLNTFSWLPASSKDAIYQNDSIFTGDHSKAVVHLHDGTQIHIQPNSLITVNMKNGQMELDLRYGNLVGDLAKDSSLVVKSGGEEFKLEGNETSTIELKKAHSETVDVKLLSGKAHLSDSKKKTAEKTALVKDAIVAAAIPKEPAISKPAPPAIQVTTADTELNFLRKTPTAPMPFEWQGSGDINHYKVEIAPTEDFSAVTSSQVAIEMKTTITDPVAPGSYFWRVTAFDSQGQSVHSAVHKVSVDILGTPSILAPQKAAEINLEVKIQPHEELATVTELKWQAHPLLKKFIYQIAQDEAFTKIIKEEQTTAFSALSPRLGNGSYWIRVAGQTETKVSSSWSEVIPFSIKLVAKQETNLAPPILVSRQIYFKVPTKNDRNPATEQAPKFEWTPVLQSKDYQVQVSKDLSFAQFENYDVDKTQILWNQYKGGKSYFRVFARGKNGEVSLPSKIGVIQVLLNSPLLHPLSSLHVEEGAEPTPRKTMAAWSEIPEAKSYLVEIDQNEAFASPKKYEFKTNAGLLTIPKPGNYKVRVRALDDQNKPMTDYSNVESLKYFYHLSMIAPVPLEPSNNISIFLQKTSEPSIWIEWNSVKGAGTYQVEVSTTEDFSKLLFSSSVVSNRFLIKDKVPTGKLYWRVRSQSKDESEFSDWTEKRNFTIYNKKNETF